MLPAVFHYQEPNNLKVYVSLNDGALQTVRHRDWRWFDFFMDDAYYGSLKGR
jgi:hypothetical protein